MAVITRTAEHLSHEDRPGWLRVFAVAVAVAALMVLPGRAQAQSPSGFQDALSIAGDYHRALSMLTGRYPDQPETAFYEYRRLTAGALAAQRAVDLQPCFAMWWAHEYMGLKLTTISHQLRDTYSETDTEADVIERLGLQMWAEATELLPVAGTACGVTPRADGLTIMPPPASD